jgi:hypothetical protein
MNRMMTLVGLIAVVLCACTSGSDPEPSSDEIVQMPSHAGGSFPLKSGVPGGRSFTGVLSFDEIEGGCWFVAADDGTSYQVVYPDGWSLDQAVGELHGPGGETIRVGDTLTVKGAIATDRSSTCQIGPIFIATEVQVPAP